ncbi:MAG: serine hydrolase domain-containing protein [Bacteroidota bacterium]
MWIRALVVLGIICGISLLMGGPYGASRSYSHLDSAALWHKWGDATLRLLKGDDLQDYFDFRHRRRRFNGVVYIAEKGTVLHQKAYGVANERTRKALTMHSSFQLASLSKVFTATAVLLLYQEGKVDLEAPVSDYLKGWPYEKMKVRHLLHHRSGMARYMAVAAWHWKKPYTPMSNQDVLRQYIRHDPITFFRPGRNFNYCNTNYVILACLVEAVSGQSFRDFMEARIFSPLCMEDAMIYSRVDDPEIPNEAIGYKAGRRGYYRAPNDYIDGVYGDKGMYASMSDLVKFDAAIRDGSLLWPETLEAAYTPGSKYRSRNYGLGWRLRTYKGAKLAYHFGWWRGFRTCYMRDLTADRTIIILSNRDHPGLNLSYWNVYNMLCKLDPELILDEAEAAAEKEETPQEEGNPT